MPGYVFILVNRSGLTLYILLKD